MRILFLAFRDSFNPYLGGGDIYINELAKGCAERGHEVTILSSKFRESAPQEEVENVRIVRLGSGFTMFLRVFAYYFTHLRGQFDAVVEEVMGGPRVPFFASLYTKERVVGILQQRHKEIFQRQFSFPVTLFLSFLERFLVLLYRDNQLIVNSARTKEDLRAIGYYDRNMHVVYPGLPKYFLSLDKENLSSRQPRVVCLTKIRRYKLIDHAIRAMENAIKIRSDCELVIAGRSNEVEPGYEDELHGLVDELGLANNVRFELNISENRKIELLGSSRALVLPSAIEGFGIVVIEANACGTPAITSDRVPAAVDGYNATVVRCSDIDSLSNAIITIVSDSKKWKAMSDNSLKWANQFTWNKSVDQFLDLIENGNSHHTVHTIET